MGNADSKVPQRSYSNNSTHWSCCRYLHSMNLMISQSSLLKCVMAKIHHSFHSRLHTKLTTVSDSCPTDRATRSHTTSCRTGLLSTGKLFLQRIRGLRTVQAKTSNRKPMRFNSFPFPATRFGDRANSF